MIRRAVVASGLAIAAAAVVLPVAPASANCQITFEGRCYNTCTAAGVAWQKAEDTLGLKLPALQCPQ